MLVVVDYGVGNLRSVVNALAAVGATARGRDDPDEVLAADRVVLPGVGAFSDGMRELEQRRLLPALRQVAVRGTRSSASASACSSSSRAARSTAP